MSGLGDAAAKDGREYCVTASTNTTAFAATSRNSSALMKYSRVESASLTTAASMKTSCGRCGATSTKGAERERQDSSGVALTASSNDEVVVSCPKERNLVCKTDDTLYLQESIS